MTPRPRKKQNKNLPVNLYYSAGYYKYKHPVTGKFYGFGKDRQEAINSAIELNHRLVKEVSFVNKVLGVQNITMNDVIEAFYNEYVPEKNYSISTFKNINNRVNHIKEFCGDTNIKFMDVMFCNSLLSQYKDDAYIKHRQTLSDLFKVAESKGYINTNPALKTLAKNNTVKIRHRLTLEQYQSIYKVAEPWLKNAMALALITLQRRGDIIMMKFSDIQDGYLLVNQNKGKRHKSLITRLKIEVTPKLKTIIDNCRDELVSPFLIHRKPERHTKWKGQQHWTQIRDETLSKAFSKTRDESGVCHSLKPEQRPTFHEIRSLGAEIYEHQYGKEFTQKLLGHSKQSMTEHYLDRPGNWTEIKFC